MGHSSGSPPAAHVLCAFPCVTCAWFSSTPRLPVASYKNSFSMTEWRIRLEGSGQSSGTPFEKCLLWSLLVLCFIYFPRVEKKKPSREQWGTFPLLLSQVLFFIHNYYLPGIFDLLLLLLLNKAFTFFFTSFSLYFFSSKYEVLVTRTLSGELQSK